ncbi:hypothetical protein PG993_013729 [Apiospora rasikravindrae]|uniref:Uncharacterized protein n=1 Tax=Apiospora rasikravindrae TaxID=990691 RepID=A0ABR1RT32_9PEZI
MLSSLRKALWFMYRWCSPTKNPDGSWNEVHLQISEWGWHIQKDVLHIPHKYGLFFPRPPQLRVREADTFLFLVSGLTCMSVLAVALILVCRYDDKPPVSWGLHAALLAHLVGFFLLVWVTGCLSKQRSPDYKWPQRKVRVE